MTAHPSPAYTQITHPHHLSPALRAQLIGCWVAVSNAGGAVVSDRFPPPPVVFADVVPAADHLVAGLAPDRSRLLLATVGEALAGWLVVHRSAHPFIAHWGTLNHIQTHPAHRHRGIGAGLVRRVARLARDEMGLEQLHVAVRAGLGLEDFYRRLGWKETGRRPGALRVAPGDDRDEILMMITL
ncbi:GNAT family N-acetyltransferase [Streptomyces gamaensis]|uniref:GNAT family N-acetyltransferase n=1 Tax=Streptomyces gamaensis TaxID=1763542 RepID=A0ABW0Z8S6_9ACTN